MAIDGSRPPVTLLDHPSRFRQLGEYGKYWAPAWSPDGKALVLANNLEHWLGTRLFIVNADGSGRSAVPGIENAIDPAWRPE